MKSISNSDYNEIISLLEKSSKLIMQYCKKMNEQDIARRCNRKIKKLRKK